MKRGLIVIFFAAALIGAAVFLLGRESQTGGADTTVTASRDTPPPTAPPPAVSSADTAVRESAAETGAALREKADRLIADGKVVQGLEIFRKAVAAEPTAKNHGDLGKLLYRLTAFDEAAIHLRAAAELDPTNADRWIALANVYYRKVDLGEAWKAEKRAREAEPGLELGRDENGMRVRKGDKAPRDP